MVKKGTKSGNNPRGSGSEDKDLWQLVTRSVRPIAKKPASPKHAAKPRTAVKVHPAKTAAQPLARAPTPPPSFTRQVAPVKQAVFDRGEEESLRKGKRDVEARLDLHGMTQAEAYAALYRAVRAAQKSGRRTLLVITGKGKAGGGALRRMLPLWLEEGELQAAVLAFAPARPEDGGEGAFYVRLRKKK